MIVRALAHTWERTKKNTKKNTDEKIDLIATQQCASLSSERGMRRQSQDRGGESDALDKWNDQFSLNGEFQQAVIMIHDLVTHDSVIAVGIGD